MACRASGGSKILLYLGLFLVATCHCTRLTKLKALDTLRGNKTLSRSQAKGGELHYGKLLIGQNSLQGATLKGTKATKSLLDVDTDYQADMGWGQLKQAKGQVDGVSKPKQDGAAVERLLKMEPKVECTGDSMKLKVQDAASTPGSLLFVDRGNHQSPLPLSKLPPSCGYTIRSTHRDLVLVAPYDGCFVALQEDSYILPLRWWGLPVKMSCPLMRQSSPNPPMVTCHAEGMVVKTEWTVPVAEIKVKLNGNWEPLMKASPRCGFSVVVHPEGVVLSVRYASCLEKKDGMYTLELAGDGETKISCPSLSPAQPEPIKNPVKPPKGQTETPSKGVYPTTPSYNSASTHAPEPTLKNPVQSVIQVTGFPENPEVPNKKPNLGSKDVYQPQLPYFPFHPNFIYPYPANPDPKLTPTVQPTPPPVTKKNGQQSYQTVPPAKVPWSPESQVPNQFNHPSQLPQNPEEEPRGQMYPQHYPYRFLPQGPYQMPVLPTQPTPTPAPKGQEKQPLSPLQPEVSKPEAPKNVWPSKAPPVPESREAEAPGGQVHQQYYPYYFPQPEPGSLPAEKPTAVPKPPATEKPAAAPQPPQPEAPQGQVHQQYYPYYFPQPQPGSLPAEKPTAVPKPPATEKPAAAPQPPQPEAPQGQVHQQYYPYYFPQPEPGSLPAEKPIAVPKPPATEKPAAAPQPPQPEAPQGQVHQQYYPYYFPQPEPGSLPAEKPTAVPKPPATEKPAAAPQPPQPEAPQGQVHQQYYPYYFPQPEPGSLPAEKPTAVPKPPATEKPAAAPQPPHPEAPQGQVHQQYYPYYFPQPEPGSLPAEKPTAVPKPPATEKPAAAPQLPQPEAPQGQVHQQYYPYYFPQPEPGSLPAEKPTAVPKPPATEKPAAAPQPPQPEAPQGQVHQQYYPYYFPQPEPGSLPAEKPTAVPKPPATEKPAAAPQPPHPEAPQGQVHQQYYPYYFPQPEPGSLPAEKPTAVPKPPATEKPTAAPQPEAPQGQVHQQYYPYYFPQPEPGSLPAEKPAAVPKPPATEKPTAAPQPEAPQGQVHQQYYPYYFPQPEPGSLPAEKPTAVPKPPATEKPTAAPQPEAPQGQVHQQYYPYHYYYPQPEPGSLPAEGPTPGPRPPATEKPEAEQPTTTAPQPETPQGQVHQQYYPYFPQPEPGSLPAEKPAAVPQPPQPQPEAPQGQVHQQYYPYYFPQPEPGSLPAEKPAAAPQLPQPEAPQGQVHQQYYPYYFPQPEPGSLPTEKPAAAPQLPQPEAPQGQVHQQYYPYHYYYPQPEPGSLPAEKPTAVPKPPATEKTTAAPQPPQPEAPQGQVHQQYYPYHYYYPQPEPGSLPAEGPTPGPRPPATEKPEAEQPTTAAPQPETPQGQVHQQYYPYYFPQPEPGSLPAEKPAAVPQPPQPEAPQGQVHQPFNPYHYYYPQPEPGSLPAEKPTAVPKPPATETPKPLYPQPFKVPGAGTNGDGNPTEKPVQIEQPQAVKPPEGQVPYPFNPYYYSQQPKHPQAVTLSPATSMQQPQQVTTPDRQDPSESAITKPKGGVVPQSPQQGSSYMPPVYCPQYCPPGLTNCCPQIAFHQHLHHIVPAGPGSKDAPQFFPGLPFLPSMAYSGFGNGFGSAVLPQKPTEAATTSTSAPILLQSLPSGNEKQPYLQPPDGNPTLLSGNNPSKQTNPEQMYPYFIPNSVYPNWPHQPQNELQNLPQRQSPAHYSMPSKPQAPGDEPVNPIVFNKQPPKEPNKLLAGNMNNPSGPNFMSLISHNLQQHITKRQNEPVVPKNSTQPETFVSGSKKSTRHEQNVDPSSEPKSYVLLQHGPPGREPNSFNESPLPFRDLVHDPNFLAQNLARHHGKLQHPQNLRPPQEQPQHPKWLGKVMSNPLPNVNYMLKPGDESESLPLLSSASHFGSLPQDPSFGAAHLKPQVFDSLKESWKPMTPFSSSQRIPPHVPGKAFRRWSTVADHQANGLNHPIQREDENQK